MSKVIRTLLCVDPQNGFVKNINYTPNLPGGDMNLAVPGADDAIKRGVNVILSSLDFFDNVRVTLDSHHPLHIANPQYWKDRSGQHPRPFTTIKQQDVIDGIWRTSIPGLHQDAIYYLGELEKRGKKTHTIWPPHCIIGTGGHLVYEPLMEALLAWQANYAIVDWNPKGSNYRREHFSGVAAEVEDVEDPLTKVNFDLVNSVENSDEAHVLGIAGSHCVPETVYGIIKNFSDPSAIKRLWLWEDCIVPVPGFEQVQIDFLNDMRASGANVIKSTDVI
ncbi:MAG TPA: hypothetical protein PLP33_25895 [Leptospiraceae bacterium]|nr:hypothetical protein [Leptospiraceae bacterium]